MRNSIVQKGVISKNVGLAHERRTKKIPSFIGQEKLEGQSTDLGPLLDRKSPHLWIKA
jgi:hypothetical protein